jgi:hypothetical protein
MLVLATLQMRAMVVTPMQPLMENANALFHSHHQHTKPPNHPF